MAFGWNDALELLQSVVSTTPATFGVVKGVETISNNQRNGSHNVADFLSYSSSIVSSINAYAAMVGKDSPQSNWTAIGVSALAITANIHKIYDDARQDKDIKLLDVQNVVGDIFCLVGDVTANSGNKLIGMQLAAMGNGIKIYGANTLGNSTMPADELFNLKNWAGFGYDLLEQSRDKIDNWLEENNISPVNTSEYMQLGKNMQQNQDFISQGFAALLSDNPQQGMNQMLNSDYAKTFDIQAKQVLAQDDAQKQQELAQVQEMSTPKMVRS